MEYEVFITSDKGMVVTENSTVTLTAEIYKNGEVYNTEGKAINY